MNEIITLNRLKKEMKNKQAESDEYAELEKPIIKPDIN